MDSKRTIKTTDSKIRVSRREKKHFCFMGAGERETCMRSTDDSTQHLLGFKIGPLISIHSSPKITYRNPKSQRLRKTVSTTSYIHTHTRRNEYMICKKI